MASKKQGTIRQLAESAGSPIDFVSAAGSVRVPQDLISELMFTRIDFWGQLRSSPGCERQLIKPSELAFRCFLICCFYFHFKFGFPFGKVKK
jgi:hypothetical protein